MLYTATACPWQLTSTPIIPSLTHCASCRVHHTHNHAHTRAHTYTHNHTPVCSYDVPLVADIHFQPKVAMMVAECFEKIRINPGQ